MTTLIYDNSFEGFLSAVFYSYEHKLSDVQFEPQRTAQPAIFGDTISVITEISKSKRVWDGLNKKCTVAEKNNLYKAFLSEIKGIENTIFNYIRFALKSSKSIAGNYSNKDVLKISQVVKMVRREKHRMDAFVRFRLTRDGIYFATVTPDFNVLPLNAKHFKDRYADQRWVIYDLKRRYGIYYDLETVSTVEIALDPTQLASEDTKLIFTESELQYQSLWKNYFKSTNIISRKNMKLHLQHVPKRYWKYLSEKHL